MAGPYDPFTPGEGDGSLMGGLTDPKEYGKIQDQWGKFLDQPGGRAAILSMGLSMMQPPSFGDNFASQLGRAIGAGGETLGRVEAENLKQGEFGLGQRRTKVAEQEAASKEGARTAAADVATMRAQIAQQAAETSRMALDMNTQLKMQGLQQQADRLAQEGRIQEANNKMREAQIAVQQSQAANQRYATEQGIAQKREAMKINAMQGYPDYLTKVQKQNQDAAVMGGAQTPVMTPEQFAEAMVTLQERGGGMPGLPMAPRNPLLPAPPLPPRGPTIRNYTGPTPSGQSGTTTGGVPWSLVQP